MHSNVKAALVAATLLGAAAPVAAQQAPSAFVFGTYYRCNQADENKSDSLVLKSLAAIYDRHLAAGEISAWGWMAHSIGGNWRRIGYLVAPTRDKLLDARAKIITELQALGAKSPAQNIATICPSHDDYIWSQIATAEGAAPAGSARMPVGLSTYYECDMGREARADEIFTTALAPIFNKHMKAGEFKSWSWFQHDLGGRARRLSTMDGPDTKSLLNAWDAVFTEASQTAPLAFQEFLSICPTHNDYVWNVVAAKP